jgi:hypothetical protein
MPGATRGDENSPDRFSIPRASIALEDDHFPLPGFPGSAPQMEDSTLNIRKSIFDLEKNPANGKNRLMYKPLMNCVHFYSGRRAAFRFP